MSKGYKYYACLKYGDNGGLVLEARNSCREAYVDLKRLEKYTTNDIIFIGVIKCKDSNPFKRILDIEQR